MDSTGGGSGTPSLFAYRRIALPSTDSQTDIFLGTASGAQVFARLLDKDTQLPTEETTGIATQPATDALGAADLSSLTPGANPVLERVGPIAGRLVPFRSALTQVGDTDMPLLMRAVALAGYHSTHRFCPGCGSATQAVNWGRSRRCDACGKQHFPRTDPAVIVAILDDADRLLLGHHVGWEATRRSIFAGFIESGESVEQAIHREIAEEVGLEVRDLVYAGSQPWPTPRSLMLGFWARSSGDVRVDGEEITTATWYTRESLLEAVAAGEVALPPKGSIASRLVQRWLMSSIGGSMVK